MKVWKYLLGGISIAILGGVSSIAIYSMIDSSKETNNIKLQDPYHNSFKLASYSSSSMSNLPDLTQAAEKSVHSVVHITTSIESHRYGAGSIYDFFFGEGQYYDQPRVQQASGSGVVISSDGFIVTNNHVIENASTIQVILNDKREYSAKLVGTDPNTDIALLKIEEEDLPTLSWGNSQELKLGEWVLAVGNPFNLNSTVTAGIVSARARSIGIVGGPMAMESFIQTDAAVNPGNSGGALVNGKGELIGINTAIASRTGSYSGYSFAVPSTIVRKVVEDLKEFGEVQRALLGVQISDVNSELVKKYDLEKIEGVFIHNIESGGAADDAGIKKGDVIVGVDGVNVNSTAQLQEQIGQHRPGEKVTLSLKRDGEMKQFDITLRNLRGGTSIIKELNSVLGASMKDADLSLLHNLGVDRGIQIIDLENGVLKNTGIKKGFIITDVNKRPVQSTEELKEIIERTGHGRPILLEGAYPNGHWTYYVFSIDK